METKVYKVLEDIAIKITSDGEQTEFKAGTTHAFSENIAKVLLGAKVIQPVLTVIRSVDPNDELCESCQ